MAEYPYDKGPEWDWFPNRDRTPEDDAEEAVKAQENSPTVVLAEIALVLAVAFGIAAVVTYALGS